MRTSAEIVKSQEGVSEVRHVVEPEHRCFDHDSRLYNSLSSEQAKEAVCSAPAEPD